MSRQNICTQHRRIHSMALIRSDIAVVQAEMRFCCPHMPNKTRFLMTIYELVWYYWGIEGLIFFTLDELGYTHWAFQHFRLSNILVKEYSNSSVLVAWLIYSFIVSAGTMIRLQVPVFFMFISIVYKRLKIINVE